MGLYIWKSFSGVSILTFKCHQLGEAKFKLFLFLAQAKAQFWPLIHLIYLHWPLLKAENWQKTTFLAHFAITRYPMVPGWCKKGFWSMGFPPARFLNWLEWVGEPDQFSTCHAGCLCWRGRGQNLAPTPCCRTVAWGEAVFFEKFKRRMLACSTGWTCGGLLACKAAETNPPAHWQTRDRGLWMQTWAFVSSWAQLQLFAVWWWLKLQQAVEKDLWD